MTLLKELAPPTNEALPAIADEYNLCNILGYNGKFPWYVAQHSDECYKQFWIDKQTKKVVPEYNENLHLREISAPIKPLKVLQSRLVATIFNKLPKHEANYAYMAGRNVRNAAENHEDNEVLIRIDLKDFFTMHNEYYVRSKLHALTGYNKELCWFITKLCSLKGSLPQGSVTSPILSIILNFEMDVALTAIAKRYNMVYTRYADDLCFSGADRENDEFWRMIREVSDAIHPFKVNWDKVEIMRNKAYRYANGMTYIGTDAGLQKVAELAGEDYRMRRTTKKLILLMGKTQASLDMSKLVSFVSTEGIERAQIHYYYVQSIKRVLGMNLTDGIKYPRDKYIKLRMEANLIAHGCKDVDLAKFRGRLGFMRLVDPAKAEKINKILAKGGAK